MSVVPVPPAASPPVTRQSGFERAAMRSLSEADVVRIVAWPDAVIDRLGYDPRSLYVETFWLAILGPTSTWLLRRLVAGLEEHPSGFDLDATETALALGLGDRAGRHAPFRRAMARCVKFEAARHEGLGMLAVHRRLPPLPQRYLVRLPAALQERHRHWLVPSRRSPTLEEARRHARRLALGLAASGEEHQVFEAQLVRWGVHPALAHEATQWVWALHNRTDQATSAHAGQSPGAGRG
ncbi:MAG TPA: hypothetical protein VLZ77_08620 [Acidimicrobiales bacterium]|nr:hypothetical protein [Acidimicrobiales bacterium]